VCALLFTARIIGFSSFLSFLPGSIVFVWRPLHLLLQRNWGLLDAIPVLQHQPRAAGRSAAVFSELSCFQATDPFPRPVFSGRPGRAQSLLGHIESRAPLSAARTEGSRARMARARAQPQHFTTNHPVWHRAAIVPCSWMRWGTSSTPRKQSTALSARGRSCRKPHPDMMWKLFMPVPSAHTGSRVF